MNRVFTCIEVNKAIKAGQAVYAHADGYEGSQRVLRARVNFGDILEIQFEMDGRTIWRSSDYSSVRIEEACAKS
jgi:hypothetical protein